MVLSGIWNFIKRHRRKFIITGAVVGGLVLLTKYAKKKFEEFQEKEAAQYVAHARRQHHFDSNQRTCNITVLSMIPNLREKLLHLLNSEELTAQLKHKPANRLEIWDELKITSFTRTIVAVYSCCLLAVTMRVKLNIIGGYMYLDSLHHHKDHVVEEEVVATQQVQQEYLATVHYLLGQGLEDLIAAVRAEVTGCLARKSLKDGFSLAAIQHTIQAVRSDIEGAIHGSCHNHLPSFMLPPDTEGADQARALSKEEETLIHLHRETRDMLHSSDFNMVLETCLDTAFARLLDRIAEYYRPQKIDSPNGTLLINPNDIEMPLAKVIPIMNGLVHSICCDAPNTFVQELLVKEQVQDFAANVYEAFSQTPPPDGATRS